MVTHRLAIWVFGPIGAGKTRLLSKLPLRGFRRIDQDAELEKEMRAAGMSSDIRGYTDAERDRFLRLREQVARTLWDQVPTWRDAGENLCFETTGDKPHLFEAELIEGRRHHYRSFGCGLRCSLEDCLAQNRTRTRVLPDELVEASWQAFERFRADGSYTRIFRNDRLEFCDDQNAAAELIQTWMELFTL
jgi:hypothetical protein